MTKIAKITACLIILLLTACGDKQVKPIPNKLSETGILTGRIAANYLPLHMPISLKIIDQNSDRYTIKAKASGHFMANLPVGRYTLQEIIIHKNKLSLQSSFTIVNKNVTNLGLLLIFSRKHRLTDDKQSIPVTLYSVNNTREIRRYFVKHYPKLSKSLPKRKFRYDKAHHLLRMDRNDLKKWHIKQWQKNQPLKRPARVFRTGVNGVNAWISYAKDGEIIRAEFIPIKTFDNLKCAAIKNRAICIHPNKTISYYLGNRHYKVRRSNLGMNVVEIKTFGSRGILAFNGKKKLAISHNWGRSWHLQKIPTKNQAQPDQANRLSIHTSRYGHFAAIKNEAFLLHLGARKRTFQVINLPVHVNYIHYLSFQLLIGPVENKEIESTDLIAVKYKSLKLKPHHFKDTQCRPLEFNYTHDPIQLIMECKKAIYYSNNKGLRWQARRFP